ncbi:pupal cuticle protein Edg-78E-like [Eupeodes corollae]|uniref:pupal cuticle protein Edg-78E-like n=1 Tax=Eupeodes corollae TaxID=290404 RepID=UPI002490152D|nr:pupal cuticle protein Edg-78E-like [Eupeodes corollae]
MSLVSFLIHLGYQPIFSLNMFKLLLVTVLLGLAAADNINKNAEIRVLDNTPADAEGNFKYGYEASNGISVQETGNAAGVSGAAQWISQEGIPIQLQYTADENGFHPSGAHLPTPPPIPAQILRALEYIRTHPSKE